MAERGYLIIYCRKDREVYPVLPAIRQGRFEAGDACSIRRFFPLRANGFCVDIHAQLHKPRGSWLIAVPTLWWLVSGSSPIIAECQIPHMAQSVFPVQASRQLHRHPAGTAGVSDLGISIIPIPETARQCTHFRLEPVVQSWIWKLPRSVFQNGINNRFQSLRRRYCRSFTQCEIFRPGSQCTA